MSAVLIPAAINAGIEVGKRLIDRLFPDTVGQAKERAEAQAHLLDMAQRGEFKQLDVVQSSDSGQVEINKIEASSESFFKSGWRPAVGWICVSGLSYQLLFRPIMTWVGTNVVHWSPPPPLETDTLMTLLFGLLGLGAYRTVEKIRSNK